MEVKSQLGSANQSTSSRKRAFNEVDGDVQTVRTNNGRFESHVVVPNGSVQLLTTTTATTDVKSENILSSVENPDIPLPIVPTAISTSSSNTSDLQPPTSTNCSPNSVILSPIAPPNNYRHSQSSPPVPSPSVPNNKKRKLSPATKLAKAQEKEAKERRRAEEKAKKEEEKKRREEERKKKEEEKEEERKKKEEKKRTKDEERLAREEEKRKKDEEKTKKERSQMRLNAFFVKPATPSSATAGNTSCGKTMGNYNVQGPTGGPETAKAEKKPLSDYEQEFPPFFLQSHVNLAPLHRFDRDYDSMKHACETIDAAFKNNRLSEEEEETPALKYCPSEIFNMIPYKRRQGRQNYPPVRQILIKMQDSALNTIELTGDGKSRNPADLLKKIPMKILKFGEDVRPPYQGTFTKQLSEQEAKRLCRNPFGRVVPDFNYDYDSEAEWEEPEEGEDLDSEGEEEVSDDGDGDMEDFLDDGDDDAANAKRRVIIGDLEPVCTGICWENDGEVDQILKSCRMEILSDTLNFPIDPFSSEYWNKPAPPSRSPLKHLTHLSNQSIERAGVSASSSQKQISQSSGLLQVPIIPSSASASSTTSATTFPPGQSTLPGAPPSHKPRRPFPPDQVAEFREVIAGSNLTKAGLVEVLKKRFPKVSKDIIKDTLSSTAKRLGEKEADKKWVLI
ncbi:uncharacterized protein PADG_07502 [Paracoccidioides brasiliensis Pb18]|uniref:Chromatin assembly factor 1 subunit A n=1 Tax=Paracoccidioides brasiliensis (strain Pb18) TaxID=502780 RepID=C1GJR6_PARBD|nr:uncharacterized protein PADG_07502 [Paracoccidioides brasiliensis Pb18]EEH42682.1 hypothetical protein PADG_07502 [Paracoccidioides brasiliensis Pb18]ODH51073.1 hypothetical protein GX48_02858 [Paracoccidioides brasiliensis]